MSTFHQRKQERAEWYHAYVKGWRQTICTACNGSGYYDHTGSPPCGACEGTGTDWVKPRCFTPIETVLLSVLEKDLDDAQSLRLFIYSNRRVAYQYVSSRHKDTHRRYTKLSFDYDPSLKQIDWCFTDPNGQTHFLQDFTLIEKEK